MKSKNKEDKKNRLIGLLAYWVIGLLGYWVIIPSALLAQTMSSEHYTVESGNFNMTSGGKESDKFKLQDVVGQTAAGIFSSKGYIVQSGFLNAAAGTFFSLTVSPTLVDFGELTANNPVERVVKITVTNGDVPGYNVWLVENHPLKTATEAEIPDTACDLDQKYPCTSLQAGRWESTTSYGLGYQLEGNTIPQDFTNIDFYRPFAALSRGEKPVLIMSSTQEKAADSTKMTIRLNVSPDQAVGQYSNVINFSAVAGI